MVIRWKDGSCRGTIAQMIADETHKQSIIGPAVDQFRAAVPWTKNRMVIVYHRRHAGREYIRMRTFNRHQVKGCWYPAPRFYMVPIEHAEELGRAIIAAGRGQSHGPTPAWYGDFEKQYAALPRGKPRTSEPALPTECDTDT